MSFTELITKVQNGDAAAIEKLLYMYQPLINKMSFNDGIFDEDLYQEQQIRFLHCLEIFSKKFSKSVTNSSDGSVFISER